MKVITVYRITETEAGFRSRVFVIASDFKAVVDMITCHPGKELFASYLLVREDLTAEETVARMSKLATR